jgi:hypothetical protein
MLLLFVLVADVDLVLFVFLCSFFCVGGAVEPLYLVFD